MENNLRPLFKSRIGMLNQLLYQVLLECKELVKYLGILIDKNLSWKQHIDLVALIVNFKNHR